MVMVSGNGVGSDRLDDRSTRLLSPKMVTIKGFCVRDGKLLCVHNPETKQWDVPGGRVEHGEHLVDTLRREFREELGIDPISVSTAPVWAWDGITEGYGHYVIGIAYRVELDADAIRPSDENDQHAWFTADELATLPMPNVHQPAYVAYMRTIG